MNGFVDLLADILNRAGIEDRYIFFRRSLELPGYFRAEKKWDLLVVRDEVLVAALETKSQVGSFGNNFNNRSEEAMGSALDLWTAYRDGVFGNSRPPFLGYLFMLEDSPRSRSAVRVFEPHFPILPEFRDSSYAKRYELLCRKLVLERHYSAASLILSAPSSVHSGDYSEPAPDLSVISFARALFAHASQYA